jgi:hypothetical protein
MTNPAFRELVDPHNAYDAHKNGMAQCARLMERAIKTLRALPEPDRPRTLSGAWPDIVRDAIDAYGYTQASMPRFRPSPHDVSVMLDVLNWITWLEQQNGGKRDARIIVARAFGYPWWMIGARFGRDPRTIQRWHDGAIARVYTRFQSQMLRLAS